MRLRDWEARLSAYLAEARERPLVWGEHDCALHGANAVLALTGEDHGAPFRGQYDSELGAAKALARFGAGTVEATYDAHLPVIATSLAGRGDIVLADGAIGVCIGTDALFVGEEGARAGLVRRPRREWQKAWAVR